MRPDSILYYSCDETSILYDTFEEHFVLQVYRNTLKRVLLLAHSCDEKKVLVVLY